MGHSLPSSLPKAFSRHSNTCTFILISLLVVKSSLLNTLKSTYIHVLNSKQYAYTYIHTYTCMFSLTYNTLILNHWLGSCKRIRTMTFIIMLSWPLKYDNCVSWLPHLMTAKVHITAISLYQYGRSRKTPITGRKIRVTCCLAFSLWCTGTCR